MRISLEETTSSEVAKAMVRARVGAGSPAMDMVLTLIVVTDDATVGETLRTAALLSHEHPSRVIGVVLGSGRGAPLLNATVRVGEDTAGESILLRLSGPLTKHAETVLLPLLLPDAPVVVWWPGKSPADPAGSPIGALAQRRLTDAESSEQAVRQLRSVGRHYSPGDTDLSWTRLTPWRALLAAALDQYANGVTGGFVESGPGNPAAKLLVAWLQSRLKVKIRERHGDLDQITQVRLTTKAGDIVIERLDDFACAYSVPGASSRTVPLGARSVAELLAEDLRRLDPDEIYQESLEQLLAQS